MALTLTTPALDAVDATAVVTRISEAEARLRAALLAGDSTRAIHVELAELRAEAARIAAEADVARAEAEAKAAQARQTHVSEVAARYASDITRRLETRLAALAPLPFPVSMPTRMPSQ